GAHYQTLQPQPEKRPWSPCEPRESRARVGVVGRRAQDADRHRQGNDPTNEVPSPTPLLGGNIISNRWTNALTAPRRPLTEFRGTSTSDRPCRSWNPERSPGLAFPKRLILLAPRPIGPSDDCPGEAHGRDWPSRFGLRPNRSGLGRRRSDRT